MLLISLPHMHAGILYSVWLFIVLAVLVAYPGKCIGLA